MKRALVVVAGLVVGCSQHSRGRKPPPPTEPRTPDSGTAAVAPPIATGPARQVLLDAADPDAPCVFGYRGPVLHLGDPKEGASFGWKLVPAPVERVEREGTTWAELRGKAVSVDFYVVPPADVTAEGPAGATPFIEARVRGGVAKSVSLFLNGHAIGAATLPRGPVKVISVKGAAAQPIPGPNELTMKFSGVPKATKEPSVEIDWVHLGVGDPDPKYAAPTSEGARENRNFAGEPGRALALRGPGFVRCEGWLPSGSIVSARARLEGDGAADAEIRVIRDRVPPTVIGTLHLEGKEPASDRVRSWPIGEVGTTGTLGAVELSVVRASPGARVVFGEPRLLGPAIDPPPKAPPRVAARGVVLVVLSHVGAKVLSPNGGSLVTPTIADLASTGVVYDAMRGGTAVANGAMGSMLTGLTARRLGMTDGDARLPAAVTTLADALRQAGITSAFFTANPMTSAPYGFDRGWSHFEAHTPLEEGQAERVFDAAATWIGEHHGEPFFVVIHARGGHPPWDVSLEQVKALPPENYTGGLDARHAGELLGKAVRTPGSFRFDDADRARAWALYGAAMEAEDKGLGRVVAALQTEGVLESTTVLVTSDVGMNEAAKVPFADAESLDEATLATPLIVKFAHDPTRGVHVAAPSGSEDIATTIVRAFALSPPLTFQGGDLFALANEADHGASRVSLAVDGEKFSLRWGPLVTLGSQMRETKLCDLTLEPTCIADVRETYPLAARLLHREVFKDLVTDKPLFAREPTSLDAPALAALKAWGR